MGFVKNYPPRGGSDCRDRDGLGGRPGYQCRSVRAGDAGGCLWAVGLGFVATVRAGSKEGCKTVRVGAG